MGRQDQIIAERLRKLAELKDQDIDPYPNKYHAMHTTKGLHEKYKSLKNGQEKKDVVKVAGRLMSVRDFGKIAFAVLNDGHGTIQLALRDKATTSSFKTFFKKYADVGDFFGFEGTPWRTDKGELSVLVKKGTILTKSILPLPEKYHGLKDDEDRLRKRYLEIIMNPETRDMFVRKAQFWGTIRSFLNERGFLEVETPALETSAGGAAATPFATHHNALDMEVFLRISMGELWQKKLMVAGYPKTFEIGRQFRNEGMDAEHLQDYTQMEFYWAYASFDEGMKLVEEMYKATAKVVFGKTKFTANGHTFDLGKKWKRIDYVETIKSETGVDVMKATEKQMIAALDKLRVEYEPTTLRPKLIDTLWKHCRKSIAGPAFLTGQLAEITPLAKRDPKNPEKVQQFQVIIGGSELGNGYSELNDPIDQESRFSEQRKLKDAGDTDAHEHDESFIEALKYGMPPTCGFGVSERLFAFLEGKPIRETVIFPLMRPTDLKTKMKGGK